MTDLGLSAAVLRYIKGDQGLPYPGEHPEALSDDQLAYLPEIEAVMATAFRDSVFGTLDEMGEHVERLVRAAHPSLSTDAIKAVGNYYAFCMK